MGSFHPPYYAASSIINMILCLISAIATISVAIIVRTSGYKTSSSKLVLYLNLSMSAWVLSKLPHTYPDYFCNVVGFMYSYCVFQVLAITFFMLKATNTALIFSDMEGTSSADLKLDRKTFWILVLSPLIVAVPSIGVGRYHKKFEWCQFDLDGEAGLAMYIFIIVLAWAILIGSLFQLRRIYNTVKTLPQTVHDEVKKQILGGPAMYAILTVIFFVLYDLILVYAVLRSPSNSDMEQYYLDYIVFSMQYLLGIGYAAIFALESDTLQVQHRQLPLPRISYHICTIPHIPPRVSI
jgi:hypothetical protein